MGQRYITFHSKYDALEGIGRLSHVLDIKILGPPTMRTGDEYHYVMYKTHLPKNRIMETLKSFFNKDVTRDRELRWFITEMGP